MFANTHQPYRLSHANKSSLDFWLIGLLLLIVLVSSIRLLTSDCPNGLSSEIILSAESLGIARPLGSAVYIITLKLLSWWLPSEALVRTYTFLSLFFTLLATFMVYLTGRRLQFPPLVNFASSLIFFFSPFVWQTSLLPHHLPFNFFVLSLSIYMTIRLLLPSKKQLFDIKVIIWSASCGLTTSQAIAFMPWGIGLLILGLGIGFSRHHVKGKTYLIALLVFLITILLSLGYLPWRITSDGVFFNSDYVFQYADLAQHFSWSRLFTWLTWYISGGYHPLFMFQSYTGSMVSIWQEIWFFVKSYPFLPLAMILVGLLANLKSVLINQQHPTSKTIDNPGRIMLALMPLMAIGGSALLLTNVHLPVFIGLTMGATYWSFRALEYCYFQLGQRTEFTKIKYIKPTLFAIIATLLIPFFSFLHSYPTLNKQARATTTNLQQAKQLINQLPSDALLCFSKAADSFLFRYVKQTLPTASLELIPFSYHWPDHPYTGPSILHGYYRRNDHSKQHQLNYIAYWSNQISRYLSDQRPVYLVLQDTPADEMLDFVVQFFQFRQAYPPLHLWYPSGQTRQLYIYRLGAIALPQKEIFSWEPKNSLGSFEGYISLCSADMLSPIIRTEGQPLLDCTLHWQIESKLPEDQLYVQFRIISDNPKMKEYSLRRLTYGRLLSRITPGKTFEENYQLLLPHLTPGHYQVQVSVIQPSTKERWPVDSDKLQAQYYLTVLEFWVKPSPDSLIKP